MWPFDRFRDKADDASNLINDASVPLVSILIRSMDRATLKRAMQSAAGQTWRNIEIVVVAACGKKHRKLPEIFEGRPVRLIFPEPDRRLPRADAANLALESARGEWLNFLDDDDELDIEHVATLMKAPRGKERVIFSAARVLDARGQAMGRISQAGSHLQLYFHARAVPCAMAVHRSLIDDGVRFDPSFAVHEDHDFQVACATRTPFLFVDAITCSWHAQIGESGSGFGANDKGEQRIKAVRRIREKWAATFDRWLRNFDDLLFAGKQYLDGGDNAAALECLERALALRGTDGQALGLCGIANFRTGDLDRAERLLERAARRLPKHRGVRDNLAQVRAQRAASR